MAVSLEHIVRSAVESVGVVLWGIEYCSDAVHAKKIRIYIDQDGGVTISKCLEVNRQINAVLGVESVDVDYNIEVSSPGIERLLFYEWQYKKFVGSVVKVKLSKLYSDTRNMQGELLSATEGKISILVEGVENCIKFTNIIKAHIVAT